MCGGGVCGGGVCVGRGVLGAMGVCVVYVVEMTTILSSPSLISMLVFFFPSQVLTIVPSSSGLSTNQSLIVDEMTVK